MTTDSKNDIEDQIDVCRNWSRYFKLLYSLALPMIPLSVIVAAKPTLPIRRDDVYQLLAVLLTIVTSILTTINPRSRGDLYRRAWSILSIEISAYKQHGDAAAVRAAYFEGESIIHSEDGRLTNVLAAMTRHGTKTLVLGGHGGRR